MLVMVALLVTLAGCGDLTPPHQSNNESTERTEGIDADIFSDAWGALTDMIVATSAVSTLADSRKKLDHVREELSAIDQADLTADEKEFLSTFYEVYWAYEDSLSLWTLASEQDGEYEGIPLYRDGRPLIERADVIVDTYDLPLRQSEVSESVEYVPDDSVERLWRLARSLTQERLVPVMEG